MRSTHYDNINQNIGVLSKLLLHLLDIKARVICTISQGIRRERLMELVSTRERIHSDYYDVAIKLSKLYIDSTVLKLKSCINSYEKHLNSIPIYDLDKKATIIKYESIIGEAINKGFHHKIDIAQFLTKEDKVFHTFLYQS